ncbi:UDP-glucuronosyl/UDP-glucosyltransferase [Cynara cardunculus var. scolymus]|uniref:UDP-glucuronosyl/UDP-glucosyltransferase n=1 Tax=Cynara cardunculus var. scolymus TaxID=59895 RepID=A0A118JZJ2_CYNCS|nr:UDP-glucuronosyl/UDP-glucosyltransferase [Cynara cardunculus var. scolymus]
MASESISQLHFLLIPLLAPGHTIPMIDMAKLLAQRPNVVVTIVTTPLNAIRYGPNLQQHINSGLPFPAAEAGLPEGCESADALPEPFVLPGLPHQIEITKVQLPQEFNPVDLATREQLERVRETELRAYGLVINSFEELEQEYVNELKKLKNGRVWCLGPLSLTNDNNLGKAVRGNNASIDEQRILNWLDSKEPVFVIYACFGSSSQVIPPQLIELGLGLEASNRPFIWVIRAGDRAKEIEEWIKETGFEERTNGRGLLIRDWTWTPQLLILSHPSVEVLERETSSQSVGGWRGGWGSTSCALGYGRQIWDYGEKRTGFKCYKQSDGCRNPRKREKKESETTCEDSSYSGENGTKTLRQLQAEEDDEERFQADLLKAVCQSLGPRQIPLTPISYNLQCLQNLICPGATLIPDQLATRNLLYVQ